MIFYFRFKIEFQNQYLLYCHGFKTLKIAYQDIQYLQIIFLGKTEYLLLLVKSQAGSKEIMLHIGSYLSDYLDVKALFTAHYPVVSDEDLIDPNFDLKK